MGTPPLTPIEQLERRVLAVEQNVRVVTIQIETLAALLKDALRAQKQANRAA